VEELAEVLAIEFSAPSAVKNSIPKVNEELRWEDQEQAVLFACSSLIAIVDTSWNRRLVQFSHFSVKEFLTSDRLAASPADALRYHHIRLEPAHTIMAQACLGVLLRLDKTMDERTINNYPLANYASHHFGQHAEFENVLSHITNGVDDLLDPDRPHFDIWVWLRMGNWGSHAWRDPDDDSDYTSTYNSSPFPAYPPRVSPLYYVSLCGDLCLAKRLISTCPQDLHTRDESGCGPLHIAVLAGQAEVSQFLVEYPIDVEIPDTKGRTLLHMAAYKGLSEVARMLLEHHSAIEEIDVNARNKKGQTALHIASRYHHSSMVALLLKFGADVNAKDTDYVTPLLFTLWQGYSNYTTPAKISETAQLLLEHGASVHVRGKDGQTPLYSASVCNLPDIVATLVRLGADVNARDQENMTPLLWVSTPRLFIIDGLAICYAAVQTLLEHGASVDARNNDGKTPLHIALQGRHRDIVELLLKFGAGSTVHLRDMNGQTPLHVAAHSNLTDIVLSLLKLGADVDAQDNDNMTPLLLTISEDVVQTLLEHGARVDPRNKNGQTPLHLASERLDAALVAFYLKLGVDIDAQDNSHRTPLHTVLLSRPRTPKGIRRRWGIFEKTTVLLLEHGANVHLEDDHGRTPLQVAAELGVENLFFRAGKTN
jgi:ankyrin repeat protein